MRQNYGVCFLFRRNFWAVGCCFAFVFLAFADVYGFIDSGRRGLLLFGQNVLPVLFPFFFISSLLIELSFFVYASKPFTPFMRKVFNTDGSSAAVFVVSLLSGYPSGARVLSQLYEKGEISRNDAIKTATFTSTCSPIFIIATMGACLYENVSAGVLIFAAHSLGAMLNGLLYRKISFGKNDYPPKQMSSVSNLRKNSSLADAVSVSLNSAIQSILAVGGLIVVFFIATNQLQNVLGLPDSVNTIVAAVLEMTNGVFRAGAGSGLIIPCAIVSFGGLCVAMQGFVFFKSFRMPLWFYLLYKITHTCLAVLICLIFVLIM